MKAVIVTSSLGALLLVISAALAQTPADTHEGHDLGSAAPAGMQQMQDNMKRMQDLMAKVHASKDPAERQKLLEQHSMAMQEQMEMMMKNHQAMQDRMGMMNMKMGK